MHQVGRLNQQDPDPVLDGTLQRPGHVVDRFAVPSEHVIDDDLAGESPAHAPLRERLDQGALHTADGQTAAYLLRFHHVLPSAYFALTPEQRRVTRNMVELEAEQRMEELEAAGG